MRKDHCNAAILSLCGFMGKAKAQGELDLIWSEVEKLKEAETPKAHPRVRCLKCGFEFTGGVTRIKGHFRGNDKNVSACTACPAQLRDRLLVEQEKTAAVLGQKRTLIQLDEDTQRSNSAPLPQQAEPKRAQPGIKESFAKGGLIKLAKADSWRLAS